ncbi:hypothetical protein [Amycolatopsis sp.]|uniref:hypothetical protein n=1 Tax=Amycolatopsis sp. TaxID=37632 RepID=UPI002D7E3A14|nr:hypothetical protein [Amycolatopsis sp.]HET6709535.1 hypothetical protein [Amycolatopsis sp.]
MTNDQARAAAERIFAAAAELGTSRQEAILVTRAVHAVKKGHPTEVALTDTPQHRRRKLAHIVGGELWKPGMDADDVLTAVLDAARSAPRDRKPPAAGEQKPAPANERKPATAAERASTAARERQRSVAA